MAGKIVSVGKSPASAKARTTFSEEETEKIISLWSEEEVLFSSCHNDYFKRDVGQNAMNHILLRLDKQGKSMESSHWALEVAYLDKFLSAPTLISPLVLS